jgi:hypothetical protein
MKNIFINILLIVGCVLLRNGAEAQTSTLYCAPSPTGPYTVATPVNVCDQVTPLNYRVYFSYGSNPSSFGLNPYRFTCTLFRNGNPIGVQTFQGSGTTVNFYFYNEPSIPLYYTMSIKFEVRKITGWQEQPQNWFGNTIYVVQQACCYPDVTITGNFSTPLQESSTWIKTSGSTVIPSTANVKLDADDVSYVELNDGFETQSGSVFLAKAYNGCDPGAPSIAVHGQNDKEPNYQEKDALVTFSEDVRFILYPNPTSGEVTIEHPDDTREIVVFDLVGQLIQRIVPTEGTITKIDLSDQPKGTYLIKTDNSQVIRLVKQ